MSVSWLLQYHFTTIFVWSLQTSQFPYSIYTDSVGYALDFRPYLRNEKQWQGFFSGWAINLIRWWESRETPQTLSLVGTDGLSLLTNQNRPFGAWKWCYVSRTGWPKSTDRQTVCRCILLSQASDTAIHGYYLSTGYYTQARTDAHTAQSIDMHRSVQAWRMLPYLATTVL
jgi:hypothetical protein